MIFALTKNTHAARFQARRGVQFSREAGNILNINSAHHSGYANGAIDIRKKGKGIKIGAKTKANSHKPRVSFKYNTYKVFGRGTNASVRNIVASSLRPGLVNAALARATRLRETSKKNATAGKKHRHVRTPLTTRIAMKKGEKRAAQKKRAGAKSGAKPSAAVVAK